MKTALFWHVLEGAIVQCDLCPHRCRIAPGKTGICNVRENRDGTLYSLNYFRVSSASVDPVEKKPLYHFFPGSSILSLGTFGCTLSCRCCQNYTIAKEFSKQDLESTHGRAAEILEVVTEHIRAAPVAEMCGVAYTYSEPMVWYETVRELAPEVRALGRKNVLVTNGYINPEPFDDLLPFIDALNIDLKGFDDAFYRTYCGGTLAPVLETIKRAVRHAHVELTALVIPTLNDSDAHFTQLRDWVAGEAGQDVPVHLSRYFPTYKLTLPPTPERTLLHGRDILKEKLSHVYVGNTGSVQDTVCPHCGALAIERHGYATRAKGLSARGDCTVCGTHIAVCS